jgi:coenzyme F420-reducing hydrogenase gamma subunit
MPSNSSGSLAMLTAILRASSRASGFLCTFEHLAARLINSQLLEVDPRPLQPDRICLSCGKAMCLSRTIPAIGAVPELRTYDCVACGVVFTEGAGAPWWREGVVV